ncbi:hypothetical protein, partial [uncultured Roseovarius sp.]|uniref:hypothetical protein n=1 Tax=uncultured Roseovarius sp. TaxID=293344 RepID=UPI0025DD60DE
KPALDRRAAARRCRGLSRLMNVHSVRTSVTRLAMREGPLQPIGPQGAFYGSGLTAVIACAGDHDLALPHH